MKKNTDFKIDVISGIEEEVLDRVTKKRCELTEKKSGAAVNKRKKLTAIIAIAAAVAVLLSIMAVIIIPLMKPSNGTVPIYTGMTVSSADSDSLETNLRLLSASGKHFALKPLNNDDINGNQESNDTNDQPIEEIIGASGSLTPIPSAQTYYAKPNEDIFITIHFDNPDNYKIMSFMLNGKPYADYMFEYGSDYENIIIKVNVGEVLGIVDYTIDAIQYADRDVLKYVEMQGDPTLSIGVYNEVQPTPTVSNEKIGTNSVSFDIDLPGENNLVTLSGGKLIAVLADGNSLVAYKALNIGQNTVSFEGLKTGTAYRYAIVAGYDALDGNGYKYDILTEKEFSTAKIINFENVNVGTNEIAFNLVWNEAFASSKPMTSFALYQGETKVKDIDFDANVISELFSNSEYTIVVEYDNNGSKETEKINFKTPKKSVPTIAIQSTHTTITSIEFEIIETDRDNVGEIVKIELINGDNVTVAESIEVRKFSSLISDTEYTVKVTCVYDLNDGNGEQTLTETKAIKTNPQSVTYVVNHYIENIENSEYTLEETRNVKGLENKSVSPPTKSYTGFTSPEIQTVTVKSDGSLVVDYYYTRNTYSIAFVTNGGDEIPSLTLKYEETIPSLPQAVRESDTFGEWFTDYKLTQAFEKTKMETENITLYAYWVGETKPGSFNYSSTSTHIKITEFKGLETDVVIPAYIYDKPVTIIGNAFAYCEEVTSIKIPDTVTVIESRAFYNCSKCKSINIPNGVTSIGEYAFSHCKELIRIEIPDNITIIENYTFNYCASIESIKIPNSVTSIGTGAFFRCQRLTDITIPDSVTSIGESAFNTCVSLKYIELPKGITSIEKQTFSACSELVSIEIPDSVTSIGNGAFSGCKGLVSIEIPGSVMSIGASAFSSCTGLIVASIGNGVTNISQGMFHGCTELSIIEIPDGVTSIGSSAFQGCKELTSINIPDTVTSIGDKAFQTCMGLENVTLGNGVTKIGKGTFDECTRLTSINIPDSVTSIEDSAFRNCTELTSITLSKGLITIGPKVFTGCTKLDSIDIPNGVTSIGEQAFYGCTKLASIDIPDSVTSIGSYVFRGCTELSSVTIGKGIASINTGMFLGCVGLKQIILPDNVTHIGSSAFEGCKYLWSITMGNGLKHIGKYAFSGCFSLESITIPDSMTNIEEYTFLGCERLYSITIGNGIKRIYTNAFSSCRNLKDINFNGTKEEWGKITKYSDWDTGTGNYTVHCTDGDLTKEES